MKTGWAVCQYRVGGREGGREGGGERGERSDLRGTGDQTSLQNVLHDAEVQPADEVVGCADLCLGWEATPSLHD